MTTRITRWAVLAIGLALPLASFAADQPDQTQGPRAQAKAKQKARNTQPIYGSQLMTPEERTEYRNKMRDAKTQAERDRIRTEHHSAMQERAKEKGITLPDQPRAKSARGPGAGAGGGMRRGGPAANGGATTP
jgi:hypothetical protein